MESESKITLDWHKDRIKSKIKKVSTQATTIVNASEKAWNLKLDVTKKSELNGVASIQESFFCRTCK